ncbi:thioredoxin domain-containing protein [Sulfurimonas aquatica]|uniref:Thioredoxin domain-containing protein n=1 Tax=Sulfurimonas aquatica TaxID=2672570 RepID=A0A975B0Q4_9BACT|nr:thioredoxin domain-containing protein [Sulfurimonas aquatica]QSZ42074.1 thioredoxin domain-containing protein [Sulfurimonas aquatica]
MSLMLKLLAITLLLSSFANATTTSKKVEDYLSDEFGDNPNLKSVKVAVDEVKALENLKGWNAYIVDVEAVIKKDPKNLIKQKMIWFSNGDIITKELTSMNSGENLADLVKPNFKPAYYSKENLIYGNVDAEHRVAIFSDPLCPFCRSFVPKAIEEMKKRPEKFAIYYYHFPLPRLHPAAVPIVRAAVAAEHKGFKDVVLKMYNIKIDSNEKDIKKVLAAFNKAVGSNIKPEDLLPKEIEEQVKFDLDVANSVMVAGTPTVYFDDKVDKTKKKYQTVK